MFVASFCCSCALGLDSRRRHSSLRRIINVKMSAETITGMKDIVRAGGYRGILLDQFGVLHDGNKPYKHANHALDCLRKENVHIVVLSNSSRRSEVAAAKLRSMGLGNLDVVTSGELSRDILRSDQSPVKQCSNLVHTNWTGRVAIDANDVGLDVRWKSMVSADEIGQVDGVVAHGTEGVTTDGNSVLSVPWDCLLQFVTNLGRVRPDCPFVCVNPDIVTVDGDVLRKMPGALAAAFERAGGRNVIRIGKPGRPAYDAALKILAAKGIDPHEVICVGDSIAHDILGALSRNLDCIYIAGGIDATAFGLSSADEPAIDQSWKIDWSVWDRLQSEAAPECGRPTFALPYFRW